MDVYTFSLIVHLGMVSNLISHSFGYRIEECTKNTTAVVESGMNLSYTYMSNNSDPFFYARIIYFDGQRYNDVCHCIHDILCYCHKSTYSVVPRNMNGTFAIDFSIHHVELSDSRIYFSDWDCCRYMQQCLFLHVINKVVYSDSSEGYIEEGDGVLFNVTKPNVTNTSTSQWIIGDETLLRWPYVVKGDSLEIAKVTRQLNEQNITYVVTEHNQTVSKIFQIKVAYGPDRLLIFSPYRSFYHVDIGENIGPITCHAECNPACDITWVTFGKSVVVIGSQLVIGNARPSYDGEYRCTAKRNGTDVMSTKSLYLVVNAKDLTFSPDRSFYHVDIGDNIGPITCHAECNPACDITWDTFGKPAVVVVTQLVIGNVRQSYGGEYRCTAKRNGTDVMSKKSLYLVVKGDNTLLIVLAVGLGVCFLGLLAVTVLIIVQGQWFKSLQICKRKDDSIGGDAYTNDTGTASSMIYTDLQRNDQNDDKNNYGQINIGHEEQAYMNVSNHI